MSGTLAGLSPTTALPFLDSMTVPVSLKSPRIFPPSSPTDENAVAICRRCIDQEIQRLEESMRMLKSRRNTLSPIARLPIEVLSKIFAFCIPESNRDSNPLAWIKVSHVCRYWRAVALDSPSLWGNLVFSRPRWAEEMLLRSKMAGLTVQADLTCMTKRMLDVVQASLGQFARIREFQLIASISTLEKLFADIPIDAPFLHSLSISAASSYIYRHGTGESFALPRHFLSGDTSRLKRLDLCQCSISWDAPFLSNLTSLKLSDINVSARPTIDQLLNALKKMPALDTLEIRNALPAVSAFSSEISQIIDLPRLTHLAISGTVPECENLVKWISAMPKTLALSCQGTETTGSDFTNILRIVSTSVRNDNSSQQLRELRLQSAIPYGLMVKGWYGASFKSNRHVPSLDLSFTWDRTAGLYATERVVTSVCSILPMQHLKCLRVSYMDVMGAPTVLDLFGNLPKLRNVHLVGDAASSFIDAFGAIEDSPADSPAEESSSTVLSKRKSAPRLPFPALQKIVLEDVYFRDEGYDDIDAYADSLINSLKDCLIERYECKAEVKEIDIFECNKVLAEDIEDLRDIVVDVHWDGLEQGFTEDEEDMSDVASFPYYFDVDDDYLPLGWF